MRSRPPGASAWRSAVAMAPGAPKSVVMSPGSRSTMVKSKISSGGVSPARSTTGR